ncbi:MAG: ester cyclase [Paludibacterium sp.]|uniref:ester cyclase n=1 Tax=Paludibacterium sp. TaxID=1917523 RepID=UPI0025EEDE7F|nr:ester cyclase [Paludibacterium sp.]MBV8049356.1 ester cyclase [Paludibacterium sp.]MBV8649469.1 ester cyclase [Paludibacterium sp.]
MTLSSVTLRLSGLALLLPILAAPAQAETLPVPRHLASAGPAAATQPLIQAALRYAAFWNSGDERFARAALADDFTDRTLPEGRAQGPSGPLQASKAFRQAVPDLSAEVADMVVAGDRVSVHLHFRGHFTGQFGAATGQGQTVDFQAFDLYRVEHGRIAENWHLEDMATLLRQLGLTKP